MMVIAGSCVEENVLEDGGRSKGEMVGWWGGGKEGRREGWKEGRRKDNRGKTPHVEVFVSVDCLK